MNLSNMNLRRFAAGSLVVATVLGGCALAGDSESKNTPAQAAKDETPEASPDVPVADAVDRLDRPQAPAGEVKEASVKAPNGDPITIKYLEADQLNIMEGDILLPTQILSATSLGRYWPGGVVPYVIDTSLPSNNRVTEAIAHWQAKTAITFVPRTNQVDYIHFRASNGCSSPIGQQGGRQYINLDTGEAPSSVRAIGIDRSVSPERVYWFYARGYATTGTLKSTDAVSSHFRYIMPPGKALASMIDVAIDKQGHLFSFYDDGTYAEGTPEDLSAYAQPKPYVLGQGKAPADVAAFAIDGDGKFSAFYKDGTVGTGTADDMTAEGTPLTLAEGKTAANVSKVEWSGAGEHPGFVTFYAEMQEQDGGAPYVKALPYAIGAAALAKTTYSGHCSTGATIHEIGHAMGLFHEQTRHDRDEHVRIVWDNIDPAQRFNFEKHSKVVGTDTGEYDFGSIMHYGPTAFSSNGGTTIERLDGVPFKEQREGLSEQDLVGVEAMYGKRR